MSLNYSREQHLISVSGLEIALSILSFMVSGEAKKEIINTKLNIFNSVNEIKSFIDFLSYGNFNFINYIFVPDLFKLYPNSVRYLQNIVKFHKLTDLNMILDIPIESKDKLIILNISEFNDVWQKPFNSDLTRNILFHKSDGTLIRLPTMIDYNYPYCHFIEDNLNIAVLKYRNGAEFIIIFGKDKLLRLD